MELRHLRYFVAAARAGNLHQAAQRLHIVQPALSRQIQALEEELGVALFERTSHGVQLTHAGTVFFEGATRLLAQVEQLSDQARRAASGHMGTLAVGFNDVAIRQASVSEAFRLFRSRFPEAELRLGLQKSQAQLKALDEGALDGGFLFDRPPHLAQYKAIEVFRDDRALVLPTSHPLAARRVLRLADLREQDFVLTRQDQLGPGWDRIMAACREGGLEPRVVQEMDNEQAIISLLMAGMGVSFLTESAKPLLPPGLLMRRLDDFSVPMTLEFVWLPTNRSPLLANFVALVEQLTAAATALAPASDPVGSSAASPASPCSTGSAKLS